MNVTEIKKEISNIRKAQARVSQAQAIARLSGNANRSEELLDVMQQNSDRIRDLERRIKGGVK